MANRDGRLTIGKPQSAAKASFVRDGLEQGSQLTQQSPTF